MDIPARLESSFVRATLLVLVSTGLALGGGCVAKDPEESAVSATVTSLSLPTCVRAGAPFELGFALSNADARPDAALVLIDAQQYGHLVNARFHLEPRDVRLFRVTDEGTPCERAPP